jgi:hypothetical protein
MQAMMNRWKVARSTYYLLTGLPLWRRVVMAVQAATVKFCSNG